MKAEMAVRSISASISACAARMAPRMTSSVTGSHDALSFVDSEALAGASPGASFKRSIGRVLDGDERHRRNQRADDHEDRGRDQAAGLLDQEGRDKRARSRRRS